MTYPPPPDGSDDPFRKQDGGPNYGTPAYGMSGAGMSGAGMSGAGYDQPAGRRANGLASMGARFAGLILDLIVVAVPTAIIGLSMGGFKTATTCTASNVCTKTVNFDASWTLELIALVIGMTYSAYFIGMRSQSIGHRIVGIKVVDSITGTPIGPGRGALRWLVMALTGSIFTIGYWSPFWDRERRRRGWHDKASNSVVLFSR